jgi:nitrate reductase beta subunit
MALLEEIELICAVMQQMFEHSDYWAKIDLNVYAELKDYTLFAMPRLLQHCNTASIIPASITE